MIDWFFKKLSNLPTTNARIAVTIVIWAMVAIRAMFSVWEPSWELLTAIVAMSGMDTLQFGMKRHTQHKPQDLAEADSIRGGPDGEIG